jgi:hypothetical protein
MENLLRTASGHVAFVDLESVAIGHPEWDLTLTALYLECGWFTDDQYDELCSWAGMTPRHRDSDTKVHRGRIAKQGNDLVRRAAVEAVQRVHGGAIGRTRARIAEHNWADCVLPRGFDKKRFEKELMIIAPILYVAVLVGINAAIAKIGMTPHPGLVRSCRPRWQPGRPRQGHDAASMVGVVVP